MDDLDTWMTDQLRRMEDVCQQLEPLFETLEQSASLPLLQDTLREQRAANRRKPERLARIYAALGVPPGPVDSPVGRALLAEARSAATFVDGLEKDVVIAQHAVRIELWELGVWRGLASVLRMLHHDHAADEVEALAAELAHTERHLASIGPSLVPDDEDEPRHAHRTTPRHPYRSPLHQGPTDS